MTREQELIECVRLLLWELENGYPKESKEEINQRIERIKELNQNKDDGESDDPGTDIAIDMGR